MKVKKLVCPNCGAPLQFDPDHPMNFCSYCGTPLLFDNESRTLNINYKEEKKIIDVAKIEKIKSDNLQTIIPVVAALLFFILAIVMVWSM